MSSTIPAYVYEKMNAADFDELRTKFDKPFPLHRIALESFLIAGWQNDPAMMSSTMKHAALDHERYNY